MSDPSLDAQSLLGYAELLRDTIERRLHPPEGTALVAPSTDGMFDDALRTVLERMLSDRLAALPPAEFVALYREVGGGAADAALLGAFDELARLRRDAVQREARLARIAAQASIGGRLLLREVSPGEAIAVGLFDPSRPDLAAYRFRANTEVRPLHRTLRVRALAEAGRVEVISDAWSGAVWSEQYRTPLAPPGATGSLGTGTAPELSRHAPLVLALDDGTVLTPPQLVGFVRAEDGTLLLDG